MEHFKFVAVVLVYRNVDDLKECIDSIYDKISDSKIIVVNSYYDDETKDIIRNVAVCNNCDFINIENKGYSYGNNRGIEFAQVNYTFDYLIVSNPDIVIAQFDASILDGYSEFGIIAPRIVAKSGRLQNPMTIVRSKVSDWLEYKGFKHNCRILIAMGICVGKIRRKFATLFQYRDSKPYQIYAAHGSFVILSKSTVNMLYPIYDENLFLFAEEGVLAYRAEKMGIKTGQFDTIVINHKEDGSMKLSNLSINEELRKSNVYFYENYIMRKSIDN